MKHELKPGGSSIPVTAENRQEYVELYSKYILEDSIQLQFQVFQQGFRQVCLTQSTHSDAKCRRLWEMP